MTGITSLVRTNLVLAAIALALGSLLLIGTVSYHYLEDWTWTESFYFTVCTLTTIGYGDLHPTSDSSRIFTALFALAGVGIAFASFGAVGSIYLKRGERALTRLANAEERR